MEIDFYRGVYASTYKTSWGIYTKLLQKIKLAKGEKILDVGCGEGKLGDYLQGVDLYGIDFHKPSVEKAIKSGKYKKVFLGSVYDMPFNSKEFDKVISIQVLQYLKDPEKAFKEMLRVSKKQVVVTAANYQWFRIKNVFFRKFKIDYERIRKYERRIDAGFFHKLASKYGVRVKLDYVSNKFDFIRNLFGKYLASEVVGTFYLN